MCKALLAREWDLMQDQAAKLSRLPNPFRMEDAIPELSTSGWNVLATDVETARAYILANFHQCKASASNDTAENDHAK